MLASPLHIRDSLFLGPSEAKDSFKEHCNNSTWIWRKILALLLLFAYSPVVITKKECSSRAWLTPGNKICRHGPSIATNDKFLKTHPCSHESVLYLGTSFARNPIFQYNHFSCAWLSWWESSLEKWNDTTQVQAWTIGGADWCFTSHSPLKAYRQMWGFVVWFSVVTPKLSAAWPPRLVLTTKEMIPESNFSLMSSRLRKHFDQIEKEITEMCWISCLQYFQVYWLWSAVTFPM